MSISRQIKKNIQKNKYDSLSEILTFYPKGFKAYTILLSILSVIIIVAGIAIFVIDLNDKKNWQIEKCLVLVVFILILYMVPLYVIVLISKLYTKKIFLIVNQGAIIFNGVLRCKEVKISDIEVIKMASGRRAECILIKVKRDKNKFSDSKIIIPIVWFGKENLREFIKAIKMQGCNCKINLNILVSYEKPYIEMYRDETTYKNLLLFVLA